MSWDDAAEYPSLVILKRTSVQEEYMQESLGGKLGLHRGQLRPLRRFIWETYEVVFPQASHQHQSSQNRIVILVGNGP